LAREGTKAHGEGCLGGVASHEAYSHVQRTTADERRRRETPTRDADERRRRETRKRRYERMAKND